MVVSRGGAFNHWVFPMTILLTPSGIARLHVTPSPSGERIKRASLVQSSEDCLVEKVLSARLCPTTYLLRGLSKAWVRCSLNLVRDKVRSTINVIELTDQ